MQGEVESSESESESDEEQEPIESENEEQIDEEPDEPDEEQVLCAICQRDEEHNPAGDNEEMVTCTNCESSGVALVALRPGRGQEPVSRVPHKNTTGICGNGYLLASGTND
jgi:hypothetical protein